MNKMTKKGMRTTVEGHSGIIITSTGTSRDSDLSIAESSGVDK